MAKKQAQLPKVVYVSRDSDADDEWDGLMVWSNIEEVAEKGKNVIVGIYRLESLITVSLEVKENPLKVG